jgi:4-hydroxythreonine-4-phosphate dehydrogenase
MLELCTPVIFANVKIMSFIKKNLESTVPLHGIDKLDQIVPGKINVLNLLERRVDLNRLTMIK